MGYSTSNPPALQSQAINGPRKWVYSSADPIGDVNSDGYFTDGYALGMKVNDELTVIDTNLGTQHLCIVNASSAAGGVDISDGLAVATADAD